ncbi:helix-hairpin-helix domain-containing protein [Peptostreptococcus sp. D1]|uniref:helix-hairpin-helix domain-containing protein n=1 Tax=Peptostreptococcus sp. D1 TaxID=72304 RepID=UPI0008E31DB4|nr:helix-hairpin-helix domain-containing protein [Peptostreptococcus sp. D1]SFE49927.1 competence protein ComEA [Peptostreptococcus sp. D1]
MERYKKMIKDKIVEIGVKKVVLTGLILTIVLIKIIFPQLNSVFGNRYLIEGHGVNSSNESHDEALRFEGQSDSSQNDIVKKENSSKTLDKDITVYITGAISNPGVISLKMGSRLDDAVKKLGGLSKDADYNKINLAMILEDGQHYVIPIVGEQESNQQSVVPGNVGGENHNFERDSGSSLQKNNDNTSSLKVNINTAAPEELEKIPGVGPATSQKIIDYREKLGKFEKIEDIKKVSGIGDKKFENMKEYIGVN